MAVETLCGYENELAVFVNGPSTQPAHTSALMQHMLQEIHTHYPSISCKDGGPTMGLMLHQGSRIYIEAPSPYLEIATAEVRTPREVVAYQRAAELLAISGIQQAAQKLNLQPSQISILRIVTDYSNKTFCGAHINILCRTNPEILTTSLLPFLATCPWGKAGGLGSSGFVLSHKAKAIQTAVSNDTRAQRPILNLKPEPLSGTGTHRLHCCSMDATMSDWGAYLMFGTLMVIGRMLDDGVCVGPAMTLVDPVKTFRDLDTDMLGRKSVKLACGLEVRPVDIQKYYLEAAEQYIEKQPNSWMTEFVQDWRARHDEYEYHPAKLSDKLDPFIKLRLYGGIVGKHGISIEEFSKWCAAICIISQHLDPSTYSQCCSREFCRERLPFVPFNLLDDHFSRNSLSWNRLSHALELWSSLRATDMDYHSVMPEGLFWRLRTQGVICDQLIREADVQYAMQHPPSDTRANARGQAIQDVIKEAGASANWDFVQSSERKMMLTDPFATSGTWQLTEQAPKKGKIM